MPESDYQTFVNESDTKSINGVKKQQRRDSLTDATCTVGDVIDHIGFGKFHIIAGIFLGLSYMAESMELVALSILGPHLQLKWGLTDSEVAILSTTGGLGMMIGAPIFGFIGDRNGRKISILLAAWTTLIAGIISVLSPNYACLYILRLLVGIGVGAGAQSVTYYLEFIKTDIRGRALMFLMIPWAVGSILVVILALVMLADTGWRWWLAMCSVPFIFIIPVVTLYLPESPRFSIAAGNTEKAMCSLQYVAHINGTSLGNIHLVEETQPERGRVQDLFTPSTRRLTLQLMIILGSIGFIYYGMIFLSSEIFSVDSSGNVDRANNSVFLDEQDVRNGYVSLLYTSLAEVPGVIIPTFIVDTVGRKWTMFFQLGGSTIVSLFLLIRRSQTLKIILLFLIRALTVGAFNVAYVYIPEAYPTAIRGIGTSMSVLVSRVFVIITPFIAQILYKQSEYTLLIYTAVCTVATLCVFLLPFDTNRRQLAAVMDSSNVCSTPKRRYIQEIESAEGFKSLTVDLSSTSESSHGFDEHLKR